jgi:hypothetical protein
MPNSLFNLLARQSQFLLLFAQCIGLASNLGILLCQLLLKLPPTFVEQRSGEGFGQLDFVIAIGAMQNGLMCAGRDDVDPHEPSDKSCDLSCD